jgi:hypothetical protein
MLIAATIHSRPYLNRVGLHGLKAVFRVPRIGIQTIGEGGRQTGSCRHIIDLLEFVHESERYVLNNLHESEFEGRCREADGVVKLTCLQCDDMTPSDYVSNKAFSDWGHVFAGDAVMASAALDRLLHRATVVNIKGQSYRMKEKRSTGLLPGSIALPESNPKGGPRTKTK